MPPRQVYGKKRTHVFGGTTFLDNSVKVKTDGAVQDLASTISKLQLTETEPPSKHRHRKPLCEVSDSYNRIINGPEGVKLSLASKECINVISPGRLLPKPASESLPEKQCPATLFAPLDNQDGHKQGVILRPSVAVEDCVSSETFAAATVPCSSAPISLLHDVRGVVDDVFHQHLDPLPSLTPSNLLSFCEFDASLSTHFHITKIAEASFSQVFLLSLPAKEPKTPGPRRATPRPSVLKLIPLTPPQSLIPRRKSKAYADLLSLCSTPTNVASEVRLLQHLSPVPGFTNFRGLHLLRGRPGSAFCAAYKTWNAAQRHQGKERSHFPDPGRKNSYGEDQLWAVIEMQDAGSDLETLIKTPMWATFGIAGLWDVFWQVVLACGKAETASRWEHRDLHMGNICVRLSGSDMISEPEREKMGSWARKTKKIGFTGLEVTVIDYTISRAEIPGQLGTEEVAFIDLEEDHALFEGDGDIEYQYDIYRFMRGAVFLDDPLADADARYAEVEAGGRTWRGYHPQTNVVWLHFVLHQLLQNFDSRAEVTEHKEVCDGRETSPSVLAGFEKVLRSLYTLLALENWGTSDLRSAGDLVAMALKRGWLDVEDVVGLIGESRSKRRKPRATMRSKSKSRSK